MAEHQLPSGRGDIDIIVMRSCIDLKVHQRVIRIELKTGSNFEIDQVIRYLADVDAVILCVVGRARAVVVKREDASGLVEYAKSTYALKLNRLLDGETGKVPGPWCWGCPLDCEHARKKAEHRANLETEFVAQLQKWAPAVDDAVDKTVQTLKMLSDGMPAAAPSAPPAEGAIGVSP